MVGRYRARDWSRQLRHAPLQGAWGCGSRHASILHGLLGCPRSVRARRDSTTSAASHRRFLARGHAGSPSPCLRRPPRRTPRSAAGHRSRPDAGPPFGSLRRGESQSQDGQRGRGERAGAPSPHGSRAWRCPMGRPLGPFERPDRVDGTESAIPTATSAVDPRWPRLRRRAPPATAWSHRRHSHLPGAVAAPSRARGRLDTRRQRPILTAVQLSNSPTDGGPPPCRW